VTANLDPEKWRAGWANPLFRGEPENIELSRVIIRHRSSRVTVTRQFIGVQVFFHANHRL